MVTFLWRAVGSPVVNDAMSFTDVPEDTWYTEAVRWEVSEGITNGTGDNKFSPDMVVDRAQVVTFLYRYSEAPAIENTTLNGPAESPFEDVATDTCYCDAVLWAVSSFPFADVAESAWYCADAAYAFNNGLYPAPA